MKMVVLEGSGVNPGDLSWETLENIGPVQIYPKTEHGQLKERVDGAEAIFLNRFTVGSAELDMMPQLRYIGIFGTGYNMIDLDACKKRGVTVCNVPHYSTFSVAQHAIAMLLEITNSVAYFNAGMKSGEWFGEKLGLPERGFYELCGKTLGIVGFGDIGRRIAGIAAAMGMTVIATSRTRTSGEEEGVRLCGLDEIFEKSDFISLNCPLNRQTEKLVNRQNIAKMKKGVVIINTSRGGVIDEAALAEALDSGRVLAAGLDVFADEPPKPGCPLLRARNCIKTPHVAWMAKEARIRLLEVTAENYRAFLQGRPKNVVG